MQKPKKVLCIMDMAGYGRSSMAVVLPVLSACGVQGCPLPTALYSTHMGGFDTPAVDDVSKKYGEKALQHYKEQDITFDAVYTGFLQGDAQFALAEKAIEQYPNAFFLCDPAMGDHGKLYSSMTLEMVKKMKKLCQKANVITPNYTEVSLLLGIEPSVLPPEQDELQNSLRKLSENKKSVIATSVPIISNGLQIAAYDLQNDSNFTVSVKTIAQNYPGTGDLFASALLGLLLQDIPVYEAVVLAASFVEASIQTTFLAENDPREGVWFENQLYRLSSYVNNWQVKNKK